jgi:hypothetical protein
MKLEEIRWKSDYAQLSREVKGIFIFVFHLNISYHSFCILLEAQLFSPPSYNIINIIQNLIYNDHHEEDFHGSTSDIAKATLNNIQQDKMHTVYIL